MTLLVLAWIAVGLAALPAALFACNLRLYLPPQAVDSTRVPGDPPATLGVSLLIPARNEAAGIADCVLAALASRQVDLELIVLDDHSTDDTAARVQSIAENDDRVRLVRGAELPAGWCGKQHACLQLAHHANRPWLAFIDADVHLTPDALARLVGHARRHQIDLLSGFPRQITESWLERLVIPLMHFVLLGFLPLSGMRRSQRPAFSAGCGQLFVTRASAYWSVGGHAAVRHSLHDGLTLPRAFRRGGFSTDLVDVTRLASCRMYHSAGQVWNGLAKNATEGLAAPDMIVPATLLLLGGQVMPFVLLGLGLIALAQGQAFSASALVAAIVGSCLAWYPRLVAAWRFGQSWRGAVAHPLGVSILLAIQWYAWARQRLGLPAHWKDRPYAAAGASAEPMFESDTTATRTDWATTAVAVQPPEIAPAPAPTPNAALDGTRWPTP